MRKISSILIANRGEPVFRAKRTCGYLGIDLHLVYEKEDRTSSWIAEGCRAAEISSYLNGDEIIQAAKDFKSSAIWPAWGFLSESAEFAEKVIKSGIIWIGPNVQAMRMLGHKGEASLAAKNAGLTTIPEIVLKASEINPEFIRKFAKTYDLPVLLKPALGGGGQGQAVIRQNSEIEQALSLVLRINKSLFGGGDIVVQKYLENVRHIEFQLLADTHGNAVILNERDCSIQRRNQKIIEESPSPALSEKLRQETIKAIAKFAKNVGYTSAGTVEFLYCGGKLYFLEVNTRLQVEHGVTEEAIAKKGTAPFLQGGCPFLDLLSEMISISEGNSLTFRQNDIMQARHAIEARIYAEDALNDFRPSPGKISFAKFTSGARVDAAFSGSSETISAKFDPMIAKVISSAETREEAVKKLEFALGGTVILGIPTNIRFCRDVLKNKEFESGKYNTLFISSNKDELLKATGISAVPAAIASAIRYEESKKKMFLKMGSARSVNSILAGVPANRKNYVLEFCGMNFSAEVMEIDSSDFLVSLCNKQVFISLKKISDDLFLAGASDGDVSKVFAVLNGDDICLNYKGETFCIKVSVASGKGLAKDPHLSPTGGRVVLVAVKPGENVKKGALLYVIEAMKMETKVFADCDGEIISIRNGVGDTVETGEMIVELRSPEVKKEKKEDASSLLIFPKEIPVAAKLISNPLGLIEKEEFFDASKTIKNYFFGYDIPADSVRSAAHIILGALEKGIVKKEAVAGMLEEIVNFIYKVKLAFSEEHATSLIYFLEHINDKDKKIPKATAALLEDIFSSSYSCELKETSVLKNACYRLLVAYQNNFETKLSLLFELLVLLAVEKKCSSPSLNKSVFSLANAPHMKRERSLLSKLSPYFKTARLAIAEEYHKEYEEFMRLDAKKPSAVLKKAELPMPVAGWFKGFQVEKFEGFELYKCGARLVAATKAASAEVKVKKDGTVSIPSLERAAIDAYKAIKLFGGVPGAETINHVFLMAPENFVLEWGGNDSSGLSLQTIKKISARVGGFARGLNISATEVIINIKAGGVVMPMIIEIRHAGVSGIIGRPPFKVSERLPEIEGDQKRLLDEKQHRLGKLLNTDRMKLLFDDGKFEELIFPDVDDIVALNVYKGKIFNQETLCYAGDFRIQGGALGEAEGKKLAASVVLAYCMNVPLIGIHDGAGANIKGSVASLGWAGAYFGAIANTGGFSSREQFVKWFESHCEREYFEKVLKYFSISDLRTSFIHLHLHLGAAVGMLVYGPSISNMSIMVDHPEVYRVLTGAATVKRVLGEETTNYELGGAVSHSQKSGEIDFVLPTEETAILHAREMVRFLSHCEGGARSNPDNSVAIRRSKNFPQPTLPVTGGIILGRDAIKANVDDGIFYETRTELEHAGNLMTGFAKLANQPVVIAATATDYGLSSPRAFKKVSMALSSAQEFRLPVILIVGAYWDALSDDARAEALYQRSEMRNLLRSVTVPRISIALGPRSIERSIHEMSDIIVYVKRGNETEYELKRASAGAHFVADSFAEAFDWISALLSVIKGDSPLSERGTVPFAIPPDLSTPYNMRNVITAVFDENSFIEIFATDHQPLITGIAKIGGRTIGVIADDPLITGGAQTVYSIAKFTRFNRICERFNIPIIELNDSPAFTPGTEQEHAGIQGEGGKSIREECLSKNLKIAVTLRQNYGGRLIHANLKTLGEPRRALVCEGAKVGVMGAEGAVGVLHSKKLAAISDKTEREREKEQLIHEYEKEKLNPEQMIKLKYAEKVVKIEELRNELLKIISNDS